MVLSAAVKNLYGLIEGKTKMLRHLQVQNNVELFCLFILHIYERVRPELTIVDAIDTLEERGPRGGVPTRRGIILGGEDALAIDGVILNLMHKSIADVPLMYYANKYKLWGSNLDNIEIFNEFDLSLDGFKFPNEYSDISFSIKKAIKSVMKHFLLIVTGK